MFLLWGADCMPDCHADSFASQTNCMNSPTIMQEMKVYIPCLDPGQR